MKHIIKYISQMRKNLRIYGVPFRIRKEQNFMWLIFVTFLLYEFCTALAWGAPEQLVPAGDFLPSRIPFTYVLDYNDADYFGDSYEKYYEQGPPGLLHMGTVTPAHSYFGPAHDAAAAQGKRPFPPVEEFVRQYKERMEKARALNKKLRQQGVGKIVAYVCMMTTGGDPDKRTGFWHFYDHWEAFMPLDAGPKPPVDPLQWQQRMPDGAEQHFYAKEHYMPLFFRYANCVNNPYWQQYMKWIIRGAAEADFDGVFVDNASSQRCYCSYCQEGFAQHLRSRYSSSELQELFQNDLSLSTNFQSLRGVETRIFWAESIYRFLAMLKAEGQRVRGAFYIFPNDLQGRPLNLEGMFRDCDLAMAENTVGTFGTNPGRVRSHVIAGIYISHVNDNIFMHQISAAAGALCRSALLTRPGYPKTEDAWQLNLATAELGIAEAAAFSAGGCFLHDAPRRYPNFAIAREKYNRFFSRHRHLYEGFWPGGCVGVLTMLSGSLWGDRLHLSSAQQLLEVLLAAHVPADPIVERALNTDLRRYRFILVPPISHLPDVWLKKLAEYARTGGQLLISAHPEIAMYDHLGRKRAAEAIAQWRRLGKLLPENSSEILRTQGSIRELSLTEEPQAELLRVAMYVDNPIHPRRLVLHLVNYNVMLGVKGGQIGVINKLPLRVPLPRGCKIRRITLTTPEQADQPLAWKQAGSFVSFVLPRLDIYAVCLLDMEA